LTEPFYVVACTDNEMINLLSPPLVLNNDTASCVLGWR